LAGLFFGLSFYVKGSAVFFPVIILLWYVLMTSRREDKVAPPFRHLLIAGGLALCVALTHGAFAWATYGKLKVSANAGALNLVEGKCREKGNIDSEGSRWLSPLFYHLGEREIKTWNEPFSNQAFFWKEGLKCIKANPAVMVTSMRYIYYLFGGNPLWPVQAWREKPAEMLYERIFLFVITPLAFIGLVVALRHPGRPEIMAALLIMSLMLLVYVFKSELRYRVPFDATTMILATVGARAIADRLSRRRGSDAPSLEKVDTS
jgi:4-amino-4-deoxy-L-arabinose transferase-like glycosyltransferase